jgi:DNA-binding beta-propeller fold protein YncE/cytochrome c
MRSWRIAGSVAALMVIGAWAIGHRLSAKDAPAAAGAKAVSDAPAADSDRSPVDLVLSPDGSWLVTANQSSSTATLVRAADGKVLHEIAVGQRPTAVALCPDGRHVLVSSGRSHELTLLEVADAKLARQATIAVGCEPHGIAVSPDGRTAYVALAAEDRLAVVDLEAKKVTGHIAVGRWPRYMALSEDGSRLVVGCSGSGGLAIVDTAARRVLFQENFTGMNFGHIHLSRDGRHAYVPWTFYGNNPTTAGFIRQGWVMGSRLARIGLENSGVRNAISLDPRGKAVADVHGLAMTSDEKTAVIAASGSHELLVIQTAELPWIGIGGSEHMDGMLSGDKNRFARIALPGRPLVVRIAADNRTAFVANPLENAVQVVDLAERKLARTIPLGGISASDKNAPLARRGEAIFYDATRCLEQWYSCHTCHYEGGTNGETIDTFNDGTNYTYKTVLPLYHVSQTGPWTWHGWQKSLDESIEKSFTTTMRGKRPSAEDTRALVEFMATLSDPPNPHRSADGALSPAAERGKTVFQSEKAGCANCHSGPLFTDGETHDVGLGSSGDRYKGYNTPSLVGIYRKPRLLHDGRVRTLDELLKGPHSPAKVTGQGDLSDDERRDLIEYLKTL